jgi:hypothetical protein
MEANSEPSKSGDEISKRQITPHEIEITEIVAEGARFGLQKRDLAVDRRFACEAMTEGEKLVVVVRDKRQKNIVLSWAQIESHQGTLTPEIRRMYYDVGDDLAARVKKVLKEPQTPVPKPKKKPPKRKKR